MRITLVTDVHANLAALEAVLRDAEERQALDEIWAMGDHVGYGPQPGECLELLRRYPLRAVAGNHDLAATGGMDTTDFNRDAAEANAWTARQLSEEDASFLRGLPEVMTHAEMTLVHGSLRMPVWEYLFSKDSAAAHLDLQQTPYSLVGHTHVPMLFEESPHRRTGAVEVKQALLQDKDVVDLREHRLVLNPGGVGQPRDGDPRAAYAVYDRDDQTISFFRIEYDIERTQAKMVAAGLPERLVRRLTYGR